MTLYIYEFDNDVHVKVLCNRKLMYITQRVKRYKEMVVMQKFLYVLKSIPKFGAVDDNTLLSWRSLCFNVCIVFFF